MPVTMVPLNKKKAELINQSFEDAASQRTK